MIKKLMVGLFILGLMAGAGFVSAGSSSASLVPHVSVPGDTMSSVFCNGGNC